MGAARKALAGPYLERGHGGAWEGRWGLYKDPQRPPASRFPPPAVRARVFTREREREEVLLGTMVHNGGV